MARSTCAWTHAVCSFTQLPNEMRRVCGHGYCQPPPGANRTASLSAPSLLEMTLDGIAVALPGYVTRIRFCSRETQSRDSGSQVLLTAGPIRQRAATADAPRGYLRLAPGVGAPTLPPVMPTYVQDDGQFRFAAEPSIVFRPAPRGDRHS